MRRAAGALTAAGVDAEQRVVLCMLDTVDFVACFFEAMAIGAIPVPVNTLLTAEDIHTMHGDSRARALVTSGARWSRLAPAVEGQPQLRAIFVDGPELPAANLEATMISLSSAMAAASPEPRALYPRSSDDPGFWLYSSGSTGRPKGRPSPARPRDHGAALRPGRARHPRGRCGVLGRQAG